MQLIYYAPYEEGKCHIYIDNYRLSKGNRRDGEKIIWFTPPKDHYLMIMQWGEDLHDVG